MTRNIRGLLVATGVAGFVILLRLLGALDGILGLAFAALIACAVPWSPYLSRRVLLVGALTLGWLPLLWWVHLPLGSVGRVSVVLALAAGGLAGWVAAGIDPRLRAKRLIPELVAVDALMLAAATVAAWAVWPLLFTSDPQHILTIMFNGWDHVAHFGISHVIQSKGVITPILGAAPDGTKWVGSGYPQHFHATVAAIMELLRGPGATSPTIALLDYSRVVALLQILVATLLAAGVAQLPKLRSRPAVAWPLTALTLAAFLFGPGTKALYTGYPNFVVACATAGLAVLLAASALEKERIKPLVAWALGGLVVVTVHDWVLLAPLALVAFWVAVILSKPGNDRERKSLLIVAAATAAASLAVVPVLFSGQSVALSIGGPPIVEMGKLLLICGTAIGLALITVARGSQAELIRSQLLLIGVPATGLCLVAGLAAYQIVEAGSLSYYFGKLATGVTLISVTALVAAAAAWTDGLKTVRVRGKLVVCAASAIFTLAAAQTFGYIGPSANDVADKAPIVSWRQGIGLLADDGGASRVFSAVTVAQGHAFASTVYVAAVPGDPVPQLADQWVRALSLNWSQNSGSSDKILGRVGLAFGQGKFSPAAVTKHLLDADKGRVVVVAPQIVDSVRAGLPTADRSRVVTW